ncbi:hypothetical protein B0H10DRAFT_1971665 [Mycena sp. CBHHK59/15]|nr:hypothetical protein B0H10DRAFT_1971665 [Mycena sp. CBHHK59/15]
MSSPLRLGGELDSDSSDHSRTASPTPSGLVFRNAMANPVPDIFGGRPSVHGPALPSDDPDQIYDDFFGEVSHNRPSPESFNDSSDAGDGSDVEDTPYDAEPPSDDTVMFSLEQPESDGLLYQHDGRLAEEQRLLAPQNSLVVSDDDDWWCWRSKEECLLDIMGGFPRSCFSEKELNATRCQNHREDILKVAGLDTKLMDGKLGNCFAVNDWFKILRHEFANPLIRPKLHLYPEDSGDRLEEARQASKWKNEVDGNISGPMARGNGGKDYYVEEVCFARVGGGDTVGPVMPMRWFLRNGELWSIVHLLRTTASGMAFVIDGTEGGCIEIPLANFFLNVRDLEQPECQARYGIPPPSNIAEERRPHFAQPWKQPWVNEWRTKANGRRVHSAPLWTYCDDTSGNVSKKWNKHNSVLFTLAGLPRVLTQMLYNIHFIATSNLSPPLEMMEAVTAMLREAQKNGIEVWDCVYKEMILIIPWFLAFQGDNPMSSEFASHVGMKAKSDKKNRPPGHAGEIDRLQEFMTAGAPRTKEDTIADLSAQLRRVLEGAPSAVDDMATESGSKDKYFQHFVDKFQTAASKLREEQKDRGSGLPDTGVSKAEEVIAMLHKLRAEMPDNIFNPVLSILDFDANSDSPVEILHVVLLGVVKYWWRDAVSRQNSKGKEELKARLSSVDVAGLNTPPIRGNTYVQYAGSLVGRDFRVILQVALVVLHGLIPQAHYDGWVALCKLAPLMFQPVIEHIPTYIQNLKDTVFDFLTATALWNTQWFNKPKFHLFVHLVEHIRRFGPLILLRSIHSSKHAPSWDIATAFSHLHAIRHLVSGGFVLTDEDGCTIAPQQAGHEVLALLDDEEFLQFMSMDGLKDKSRARFYMPIQGTLPCPWADTLASKAGIATLLKHGDKAQKCRSIILPNGDKIEVTKYVIYHDRKGQTSSVGLVEEILAEPETEAVLGILVSRCEIGPDVLPYRLPSCTAQLDKRQMLAFENQELVCAVNVNHNCAAHGCRMTLTRRTTQERQLTDHLENEVTHTIQPYDCFLNLAQLRSATDTQKLRSGVRLPGLSLVEAIETSIRNKKQLEREAKAAVDAKEAERVEKEAQKLSKAQEKEERAKAKAKGKEKGTAKVSAPKARKRKRSEDDPDFAEGGEALEYRPRPSKSRTIQQIIQDE